MPDHSTYRLTTPPFLFLSLLIGMAACGILSSDDDPPELDPGPRNYEWTVDSVYSAPGGWMNTIWGSSPNDVWIASSGGFEKLWHYDGEAWTPYPYRKGPSGFTGDFYSIFGFARDDVWMGGKGPRGEGIWHYNGQEWKLSHTYQPEGMGEPNILDIWGTSSSDMYAVGTVSTGQDNPSYKGFILHYDGMRWKELLMTDFGMQFQRIRKNNEGVYLLGFGPYSTQTISDSVSFYRFNNKSLSEMYSKPVSETGSPGLNEFGNKIYVIVENELMEVQNNDFKNILSFNEREVFGVNGRHAKDMFILSTTVVMHYNGENTQDLFQLDNQEGTLWRGIVFENDVFFIARDYEVGTNLIYHGTLTNEKEGE